MPINYSVQDESPPAMSIFKKTGEVLDEALESPSDGQNNPYKRKIPLIFMHEQDSYRKTQQFSRKWWHSCPYHKMFCIKWSPGHCQPQCMWSLPTENLEGFKTVATFTSTDGGTGWKMNVVFHLIFKIVLTPFTYCEKKCKVLLKKPGNKSLVFQFLRETEKNSTWLSVINPT